MPLEKCLNCIVFGLAEISFAICFYETFCRGLIYRRDRALDLSISDRPEGLSLRSRYDIMSQAEH